MAQGRPGCTAANRNAAAVNHSDACRIRIEQLMAEDRRPRYMRAMERLAEAALRKESEKVEATATTTATNSGIPGGHATAATTKRSADTVPEGERVSKVPTPAQVRGEVREREEEVGSPEKRLRRNEVGMISALNAGTQCSGNLRVISPTTVCSIERVKELLRTQGSRCALGAEQISKGTTELIMRIQRHRNCEFVCLYHAKERVPFEALKVEDDHLIVIGEALVVTNSPIIADALEEAARIGLSRILVQERFGNVGKEEVAPIIFEAVSRSGTD